MPTIILTTEIYAPIQRCFDLSRSIDLHKATTKQTGEEAIAGVTNGLINLNETVTWRAKHFGIRQKLTSKITVMDTPHYFRDEQIKGAFKTIKHDHYFSEETDCTVMKDVFYFESPFGIFGKIFNHLILINYMKKFLEERNAMIKKYAENEQWKLYLPTNH